MPQFSFHWPIQRIHNRIMNRLKYSMWLTHNKNFKAELLIPSKLSTHSIHMDGGFFVLSLGQKTSTTKQKNVKFEFISPSLAFSYIWRDEKFEHRIKKVGNSSLFFSATENIWWLICQNNSLSQWKIFPVCEHENCLISHVPKSWHSLVMK